MINHSQSPQDRAGNLWPALQLQIQRPYMYGLVERDVQHDFWCSAPCGLHTDTSCCWRSTAIKLSSLRSACTFPIDLKCDSAVTNWTITSFTGRPWFPLSCMNLHRFWPCPNKCNFYRKKKKRTVPPHNVALVWIHKLKNFFSCLASNFGVLPINLNGQLLVRLSFAAFCEPNTPSPRKSSTLWHLLSVLPIWKKESRKSGYKSRQMNATVGLWRLFPLLDDKILIVRISSRIGQQCNSLTTTPLILDGFLVLMVVRY